MDAINSSFFEIYLHDVKHTVNVSDISPETTLNEFLREIKGLTGTKVMCREGGCGVCIVTATVHSPNKKPHTFAVNSCLVSLLSCAGWRISTIEGIGNRTVGFHPIQSALAKFNGTQCGFCSPGMVMNMYALYEKGDLTMEEIENSFGGNMCRCTGYRSILAAFKQYASDFDKKNIGEVKDIEDFSKCKIEKCAKICTTACINLKPVHFLLGNDRWYKVNTIKEIIDAFKKNPNKTCRLVGGNTAQGVYKIIGKSDVYIDITSVQEMLMYELNTNNFLIGGAVSLTKTIQIFKSTSESDANFLYMAKMAEHIDLVANVPVRNIGTLAGNLSIKHKYNEFPSDIFLIFETVGAMITIVDIRNRETRLKPTDYLKFDMNQKVIKMITLPSLDTSYKYESYKIIPRAQNSHAMVNAGFLFQFDKNNKILNAKIVYGGINPTFIHADKAEAYLRGKNLFDNDVMQQLFSILDSELKPNHVLPDPSPEYRKQLAIALCYKYILSIAPKVVAAKISGGTKLTRPLSTGSQDYTTQESMYPLTQPVNKLEALAQTSGEAEYIIDMPDPRHQTYAAFVLAKASPKSVIQNINTDVAMKLDGVITFVDKNDIPGKNTFIPKGVTILPEDEEIFCSGTVLYYNQPIGLIVAKSQNIAEQGAKLVEIKYQPPNEPIYITIQSAIEHNKFEHSKTILPKREGNNVKKVVTGKMFIDRQYHYHMETQVCIAVPIENGEFNLFPGSQWMDLAQCAGAACLGIPLNKINVQVRRLGGSYGGKLSRNALISSAALLAANKIKLPVKIWMPFSDNMDAIGKRHPNYLEFTNKVDEKGVIQSLKMTTYTDMGLHINDYPVDLMERLLQDTYVSDTFEIDVNYTRTDNAPSCWTRAPGSAEGVAMIESIMEQTAIELGVDSLDLRLANMADVHLIKYVNDLKEWAKVDEVKAEIKQFNKENRWRKRGISVLPMAYHLQFLGTQNVILSVYAGDGTISIAHGGIEIGQGVNTKAVQVVAYYLGIDMDLICCKPSNNLACPNSIATGGSITSESICIALKSCCEELIKRMADIKKQNRKADWAQLVKLCYESGIDLCVTSIFVGTNDSDYEIYGVVSSEVEVDILTGNFNIARVHLLMDVGDSLSPIIDIGQVEGAFIMGSGYYTSEKIIMDPTTGELKNNRTWNYKPPGAKDIPIDFKVKFPSNNPNPLSPFKTKATGEPPLCLAFSIPLAIRDAIKSARLDSSKDNSAWYSIDGPSTVQHNFLSSKNDYKQYTL